MVRIRIRNRMGNVVLNKSSSATVVTNIKPVEGVVGKKRIDKLKKAIRNRNQRIRRETKKVMGEYSRENADKLIKKQFLPAAIRVDFSAIKTVKDYNSLIRMIENDKGKAWKAARDIKAQQWLEEAVLNSLNIDRDTDPALFARIETMTAYEIVEFAMKNSNLIGDLFDHYAMVSQDPDERNARWSKTRKALGLSEEIPESNIFTVGGIGS